MAGSKESGQERGAVIETVKAHNSLRAEIEAAGVHLERDKGLCPFHPDKHPSFSIKGERWKCFVCNEGGDVIDFTAKYYGLDTKGAIRMLADRAGLSMQTPIDRSMAAQARQERERKAELLRAFREWEQTTVNEISEILRSYHHLRATRTAFTEAELQSMAELQGEIDILEYRYEILCHKDDAAKFGLYQEMIYAGN